MHITFSLIAGLPGQADDTASVSADVLTHNGIAYDLSAIQDGDSAEPQGEGHPFIGEIERIGGVLHLNLRWQYDAATAEPNQPPERPVLTVSDGQIPDPVIRRKEAEA